jgi:hypothetical protein
VISPLWGFFVIVILLTFFYMALPLPCFGDFAPLGLFVIVILLTFFYMALPCFGDFAPLGLFRYCYTADFSTLLWLRLLLQ